VPQTRVNATSQWRATLLQPEVTADLQQHTAINRVGNLPLLHQAFGIAQPVKGLCVIALIGCATWASPRKPYSARLS
jgi:hypothetical protein